MTILTQPISVCSPANPQPGIHKTDQGDSTLLLATKHKLPFFSRAADAVDKNEVPSKDATAAVHNAAGTKTVELKDPSSLAKLASAIDEQLPPLLSMIVDGLPPMQQSKYVHEAENHMHQYIQRHQNATFLEPYFRAGLCSTSYMHHGAINVDRLVAISIQYALMFLVDDLFFDDPSEFLQDQCGVSHSVCGSPDSIREYLDRLNAIFGQQVQPSNPTPLMESMMWELGRDMLELSNPEWFENFVACVVEHHHTGVASHADIVQGDNLCFQDLESYAVMRAGNVGGKFIQLMVEFASDTYIPSIWRATPYLENITVATSIHIGFANDIFSYHRESSIEQNPRNLITVMTACEGEPFVKTVHMAVGLVNAYAHTIVDLGAEAWNPTLQNHLRDIKALIAGNVYFSFIDNRYRHPESFFPELRDTNINWKIVPDVKGPGL